jgi:hypothetical protein
VCVGNKLLQKLHTMSAAPVMTHPSAAADALLLLLHMGDLRPCSIEELGKGCCLPKNLCALTYC